jgi:hypothetical protein
MKSIETLIWILKAFGWLSIAFGFIFLIFFIGPQFFSLANISSIQLFLSGLINLCLAYGLSKEEKWAWYSGLVIFNLGILSSIIQLFFRFSFVNIFSLAFLIFLLYLLIKERQIFITQPKEKISQWFRKPYFVVVVVGTLLLYLIIGVLAYWYWWMPR